MFSRLLILVVFLSASGVAYPASVQNLELMNTALEQKSTQSPDNPSKKPGQHAEIPIPVQIIPEPKKPAPFAQQGQLNKHLIIDIERPGIAGLLHRSGFAQTATFRKDNQEETDDQTLVLNEIKTSIKDINATFNQMENRALFLLEGIGIPNVHAMSSLQIDMQSGAGSLKNMPASRIENLENSNNPQDVAANEQSMEDQPLIYQILFFRLPYLLKFISENLVGVVFIVIVWLMVKGVIAFVKWKSKKNKRRRKVKKNRTVDGIIKY